MRKAGWSRSVQIPQDDSKNQEMLDSTTTSVMNSTDPGLLPALPPPPGVTPNLHNPPNENATIIGVMAMYLVLTTTCVAARTFTRARVHQEMWWDDWSMIAAWVGMVGLATCSILQLRFGGGVDLWNVTANQFANFEKVFETIEIVSRVSLFFAKLSILLLFLRIFCPVGTRCTVLWRMIWAVIVFDLLYTIALILVITLQCAPKGLSMGNVCLDEYLILVTFSVINVSCDIVVLVIPIVAVSRLQMGSRRKIGLTVVFAFGALAPLSSIARLGYQIPQAGNVNRTIFLVNVSILAYAELVIAILVGCVPVLSIWYSRVQNSKWARREALRPRTPRLFAKRQADGAIRMQTIPRNSDRSDPYPMVSLDEAEVERDQSSSSSGLDQDETPMISPIRENHPWYPTTPSGMSPATVIVS